MEFKNRQGSHPNRKILNIISQTPTQIVVDVERDNTGVTEEGTKLTAEVFNTFQNEIKAEIAESTERLLEPKLESENIVAGSNIEVTKNGKNVTITALSGGAGSITLNGSVTTTPKFYAPTSSGYSGYTDVYYESELPTIGSTVSGTGGKYVLVNGAATVDSTSYDDESEYWTYYYTSKAPMWKTVNSNKGYTYQSIYNNSTGTSSGTITWTGGQQYSNMNNIFVIVAKQGTTGYRTFVVNCDAASSSTPYCIYGSSSSYYVKFYFSSARTITISGANGMTITKVMQLYPNALNTL